MSNNFISVERVNEVRPHHNADRLDIIQVLGYQVVVSKGSFEVGDACVFFPPDMLIAPGMAEELGVSKYLKYAVYPGDPAKTPCRVGACRLRGEPSFGFIVPGEGDFGANVNRKYGGVKYQPVIQIRCGDVVSPCPAEFHEYTNIQHYQRYQVIEPGELVRITEKRHGTNCRTGIIGGEIMCGSHHTRRTLDSVYGKFLPLVKPLLEHLSNDDVVVFGEIFGIGIQEMDYGTEPTLEVFDISVNGKYLDWVGVKRLLTKFKVPSVPLLYRGPFSELALRDCTDGPTQALGVIKSKFKGREGCVVTPLTERTHPPIGRVILKSVSSDYYARKS